MNEFQTDIFWILLPAVIFIVTAIFLLYRKRRSSKRGVLLTGLCDSGKTVLFSQLVHGKYVETQTSMKENLGEFSTKNGVLRLIDIPGYERLRGKYFDQYKSMARGLMYVVDSVTLQKDIRDAAEFLYNILSDPVIGDISSLLIVCNKQDLQLAKSTTIIKSMLEKELNALRITKSSQLESVDPKTHKLRHLGKEGQEFAFSNLSFQIEFVEASASAEHTNTSELQKWLSCLCS